MAVEIIPTFDRRVKIHASQLETRDYHLIAFRNEKDKLKKITYSSDRYGRELYCLWDYRITEGKAPWLLEQRLTDRGLSMATLHYLSPEGFLNPATGKPLDAPRAELLYSFGFHQDTLSMLMNDEDFKFLINGVENIKKRHFENIANRSRVLRERAAAG